MPRREEIQMARALALSLAEPDLSPGATLTVGLISKRGGGALRTSTATTAPLRSVPHVVANQPQPLIPAHRQCRCSRCRYRHRHCTWMTPTSDKAGAESRELAGLPSDRPSLQSLLLNPKFKGAMTAEQLSAQRVEGGRRRLRAKSHV